MRVSVDTSGRRWWRQVLLIAVLAMAMAAPSALADPGSAAVDPEVQGGRPAPPGRYPYMVALVARGLPRAEGYECGGSLISPDTVLTAAHCVAGRRATEFDVIVGSVDLTLSDGLRVPVRQIRVHPRFDVAVAADTAILQLAQSVSAAPVVVARPDQPDLWAPGRMARLIGWGLTDPNGVVSTRLLEGRLPLLDPSVCAGAYGSEYSAWGHLCAGSTSVNACIGDSGSPLTAWEGGERVQIGIVSWGGGYCGSAEAPGVFTKVASRYERHVAPWLDPDSAPDAPRSLTATVSGGAVEVRWRPPYYDGGTPILGYRLVFSPGDTVLHVAATSRLAVASGFQPGAAYTVSVTARNAIGRSAPATIDFVG